MSLMEHSRENGLEFLNYRKNFLACYVSGSLQIWGVSNVALPVIIASCSKCPPLQKSAGYSVLRTR